MSAPSHDPRSAIRLTPEIVIDPNYRIVPPDGARQTTEPSSFEDARRRGFDEGRRYEQNGGNRMSAKADDHGGGHGGVPEGAKKIFYYGIAALFALWVFLMTTDTLHKFWDPVGYREAQRARLLDERLDAEERARISMLGRYPDRAAAGVVGGNVSRPPNNAPRQPSPQEIWDRTFHRTTNTCAPCDQTRGWNYVQDPVTCQCDGARWRPGPPPR